MPRTISETLQKDSFKIVFFSLHINVLEKKTCLISPGIVASVCLEVANIRYCNTCSGAVVDHRTPGIGAVGVVKGVGTGCSIIEYGLYRITDAWFVEAWSRQNGRGKKQNPP